MSSAATKQEIAEIKVIDGHNDLAWAARQQLDYAVQGLDQSQPQFHTDLPRLRKGQVGGQFWSVWVDPQLEGADQVVATLEQIDWVKRFIAKYPEQLQYAGTAAEAQEAMAAGKIASLIGVEGGAQFADSAATLRQYAALGARYMTLTWARTISWADSATDDAVHDGLNDYGKAIVREMNRIGMIVDLAHVSPATMRDALAVSTKPVLVTHSGATGICNHPRNVPDDVIKQIGAAGGVVMVAFVPTFLSQERRDWWNNGGEGEGPAVTVKHVADHIEYIRNLAGVDAVGLGADYDGTDDMPQGLEDVSRYPALLAELSERGWSAAELRKLASENVLRVLAANDTNYEAFLAGTAGEPDPELMLPAKPVADHE